MLYVSKQTEMRNIEIWNIGHLIEHIKPYKDKKIIAIPTEKYFKDGN